MRRSVLHYLVVNHAFDFNGQFLVTSDLVYVLCKTNFALVVDCVFALVHDCLFEEDVNLTGGESFLSWTVRLRSSLIYSVLRHFQIRLRDSSISSLLRYLQSLASVLV